MSSVKAILLLLGLATTNISIASGTKLVEGSSQHIAADVPVEGIEHGPISLPSGIEVMVTKDQQVVILASNGSLLVDLEKAMNNATVQQMERAQLDYSALKLKLGSMTSGGSQKAVACQHEELLANLALIEMGIACALAVGTGGLATGACAAATVMFAVAYYNWQECEERHTEDGPMG